MKYTAKMYCAALAALVFGCADGTDGNPRPTGTRTITVNSALTRTTIQYEGSDVSHLVWNEGDRVAYITDLPGQTFKTAVVSENRFTAEIPAQATEEDSLIVLWPPDGAEGKTLTETALRLSDMTTQQAGALFDGRLLPMYASMRIPQGDEIDAMYRPLGSVVRFSIDAVGHETEIMRSVTLSANEYLTGAYSYGPEDTPWIFTGTSKTVKTTVTGEQAGLNNEFNVYMVVNPAAYTGVEARIETDAGIYRFSDGSMNLNQEGRTLYRINLSLDKKPEPKKTFYTQVTDITELTTDGEYLIVADKDGSSYYTPDQKTMAMLSPATIGFSAEGIERTDDTACYSWKIAKNDENGAYSLYSNRLHSYVGSAGAILVNDYGKFFFTDEIPQTADGDVIYYWNITVDNRKAVIKSQRMENAYFQYNANYNVRYFCLCTPDTDGVRDVKIFKLRD